MSSNPSPHLAADLLGDLGPSLTLQKAFVSLSGQREDSARVNTVKRLARGKDSEKL